MMPIIVVWTLTLLNHAPMDWNRPWRGSHRDLERCEHAKANGETALRRSGIHSRRARGRVTTSVLSSILGSILGGGSMKVSHVHCRVRDLPAAARWFEQGRKSRCSCRIRLKSDSVAKLAECPDHSGSADSSGVFRNCRAPFLIANAFIKDYPDQLTDAMRNCADGFVVAEARNETTVDDLEDASFNFDGSIGSLIEKATHVPVPLR